MGVLWYFIPRFVWFIYCQWLDSLGHELSVASRSLPFGGQPITAFIICLCVLTHWGQNNNDRHFAYDILKLMLLYENVYIWLKFRWNSIHMIQLIITHIFVR